MSLETISADLLETEKKRTIPSNIKVQRESLPVYQYRSQLIDTIANNSVTIVKGETGCGKSTQVITSFGFSRQSELLFIIIILV